MTCFFRDVNLHDALEKRMQLSVAAQHRALAVIDRILTAEDEEEEQFRNVRPMRDTCREPTRMYFGIPRTFSPVRLTNS